MVLGDLGGRIAGALRKLQDKSVLDEELLNEVLLEITRALLEADVNVRLVKTLRDNVKGSAGLEEAAAGVNKQKLVHRAVYQELCNMLGGSSIKKAYQLRKGRSNVVMFVGLQGSGKTTTCAKYARYFQRKGWRTALVCADTFRAGAFDQLKQNATKIRVPFFGSYTETDPVKIAEEGVNKFKSEDYELIIVDTSGRHKQEVALFEEMQQVSAAVNPDEHIFVMDSTQGQAVYDQAKAFGEAVDIGSVIMTKIDGHAKGGGALSAVAATGSPVIFVGTGEHFDEFEPFEADRFVSRLLGMGDLKGLVDKMRDVGFEEEAPEMFERITSGQFALRDMRKQFQMLLSMGPLNQVMGMIPGLSEDLIPKAREKEGQARVKKFLCIMDSMTDAELDGVIDITKHEDSNFSRLRRIARGAGVHVVDVHGLVEEFKRIKKMVSKMGKLGKMKGGDMAAFQRNPQQMMQKLGGMMDPRMLQQMGGMDGMKNMMKELSKVDMGAMMKSLGGGGMGNLGALFGKK